jgi:hypothetical protein
MFLETLQSQLPSGNVSHSGWTRETHVPVFEEHLFGKLTVLFQDEGVER